MLNGSLVGRPSRFVQALAPALVLLLLAGPGCASSSQPSEADELYHEGLAKSKGDTLGAIRVFEDGLHQYPTHTRMRFGLARLQYDTGEVQHLEERAAFKAARAAEEAGHQGDVQKLEHDAQDHHAKALPLYRACRENLKIVVADDDDPIRQAWAYEIIMRCDIFFDEYRQAVDDLTKAIEIGRPQGQKLAEWQDFLLQLKTLAGARKLPAN